MSVTGEPGGGPLLCGTPVVDTMGALACGQAVVTALLHRERTGEGQRVDVALLDLALLANAARLIMYLATGEEIGRARQRASVHGALPGVRRRRTAGSTSAVWAEKLWAPFCKAIDRPELADDPRFADRTTRFAHREELRAIVVPDLPRAARSRSGWRGSRRPTCCARPSTTSQTLRERSAGARQRHARRGGASARRAVHDARPRHALRADARHAPHPGARRSASTPTPCSREAGLGPDEIRHLRAQRILA